MDKYETLKNIVNDYIFHLEEINKKRCSIQQKDGTLAMQEIRNFGLLISNVRKIEDAIPKNQ